MSKLLMAVALSGAESAAFNVTFEPFGQPCCSWNKCGSCGGTTDYCTASQSNCENDCNGQWCPGGAAGPSGYDMKSACDVPTTGGNAYACIDWSVGSAAMKNAAAAYSQRTGYANAIFGVGSFGGDKTNMGKCYKLNVVGVSTPLLVQVVNQGGDVASGQFDLQVGDGGFGIFDACAAPTSKGAPAMFSGSAESWGQRYGGWQQRSDCDKLPAGPASGAVPTGEATLPELCRTAFDLGFKGNGNAKITGGERVPCPTELRALTGLDRTDGDSSEHVGSGEVTTMMDCCKPSAGWIGNVPNAAALFPAVVTCVADGYTRVQHNSIFQNTYAQEVAVLV